MIIIVVEFKKVAESGKNTHLAGEGAPGFPASQALLRAWGVWGEGAVLALTQFADPTTADDVNVFDRTREDVHTGRGGAFRRGFDPDRERTTKRFVCPVFGRGGAPVGFRIRVLNGPAVQFVSTAETSMNLDGATV